MDKRKIRKILKSRLDHELTDEEFNEFNVFFAYLKNAAKICLLQIDSRVTEDMPLLPFIRFDVKTMKMTVEWLNSESGQDSEKKQHDALYIRVPFNGRYVSDNPHACAIRTILQYRERLING